MPKLLFGCLHFFLQTDVRHLFSFGSSNPDKGMKMDSDTSCCGFACFETDAGIEIGEETGGYDEHMIAWGGENIDQSLRSWLCGGRIEVAEGAFVAHMWRDANNPKTRLKHCDCRVQGKGWDAEG